MADKNTPEENNGATGTGGAPDNKASGGRGWHGNSEGHAAAGRKGGQTVSQNREHMASIGRKGGQAVSKNRDHMAEIGRKGGQSRNERGEDETETAEQKPVRQRKAA